MKSDRCEKTLIIKYFHCFADMGKKLQSESCGSGIYGKFKIVWIYTFLVKLGRIRINAGMPAVLLLTVGADTV